MIRLLLALSFLLMHSKLLAVQYIEMDSSSVIEVNLSFRNHNRIGITGDRIKKAFFKSNNISVDVEEESGQLFVQSLWPQCPPTTISVISCSGCVQELELHFCDMPTEIVLLQPFLGIDNCEPNCNEAPSSPCMPLDQDNITTLVDGFIKGEIPEGYTSVEDQDSPITICKGLKLQRIGRLVSCEQIVFIYRLHNVSKEVVCVKECQVNVLDGDWVFLDRYKLKCNECALALIGCIR